ncbi:uncharacterized protein BDR25DRAFT_270242 [Lindgomyces ingoldianus]|uniref:Uncharacterized protein n=1 Tax=Lindgomyces ingoldianus TaxID=673940 RepID=A0ACB6QEZ1_9PLEO|nr:uncharacterized protein BDR25DRAFT_270242 [Lindgomyces ingoldianus]KAF2465584.1 hypothetical protein BDR25DRAFT_270242 [Lindgomyces ingoldianus]
MIIPRTIYQESPPERRSRISNNPTLLFSWWCTIFSLVIIGFRLSGRYIRNERLFREDKIMAWSIIPLMARMGFVHVVLIYGTNNVDVDGLDDPLLLHHREIGSKMVLCARIFYALFIWMAKFTVSEFLKRMTERFWKKGYEMGLRLIRGFLVATFIAVVIGTLAECDPFDHYWQVVPDAGPKCRQGYGHLLTMGVTDIITDVLLVLFPIPIIIRSAMPLKRKLSLISLFSLSLILIGIAGARVPLVIKRFGLQQFRTVLASVEILAAAAVSNAIILGSFLRDRGIKKSKYRFGSATDSMDRRSSTRRPTLQPWGSDEDLARDLGYRPNPELTQQPNSVPRPAPVADLDLLSPHGKHVPFPNSNWAFPNRQSGISQDSEESDLKARTPEDPMPSPRESRGAGGRRVSFFDVGGLLEGGSHSSTTTSPTDSVIAHDFAAPPRRGSRASNGLFPNGRAHPPSARRSSRLSQQSEDYEMTVRPSQQLQDPGGLLCESHELAVEEDTSSPTPPQRAPIELTITETSPGSVSSLQDAGGLIPSNIFKHSQ